MYEQSLKLLLRAEKISVEKIITYLRDILAKERLIEEMFTEMKYDIDKIKD
ncbi:MAG: hypothetical protein ABI462_07645 [Ignavibacteria bacterium]